MPNRFWKAGRKCGLGRLNAKKRRRRNLKKNGYVPNAKSACGKHCEAGDSKRQRRTKCRLMWCAAIKLCATLLKRCRKRWKSYMKFTVWAKPKSVNSVWKFWTYARQSTNRTTGRLKIVKPYWTNLMSVNSSYNRLCCNGAKNRRRWKILLRTRSAPTIVYRIWYAIHLK